MPPIPLPVIPNVFRVAIGWGPTAAGITATNVIHIQSASVTGGSTGVMEALDDAVTAAMWGTLADAWHATDVAITPLDGTSPTQHFVPATPANWQGGTGGDLAPQVSAVAKITTAFRGRANRGRIFLPAPAEGQTTAGKLNDGTNVSATTAWNAFAAALLADVDFTGALGVASYDRKHSGAGAHFHPTTGVLVEQVLATQRRRQSRLR